MPSEFARKLTLFIGLCLVLVSIEPLHARAREDCSRKASHGSRDYNMMGRVARGSTGGSAFTGITGSRSRSGNSLSSISRGVYGSSRNQMAYNMEYQHCMSSFGG